MEFLQQEELIMATQPTERPLTPLRQRMLDDMAIRRMAEKTARYRFIDLVLAQCNRWQRIVPASYPDA